MMFLRRVGWLFVAPGRLIEDIREDRTKWWQPWIWLSAIYCAVDYVAIPIRIAVTKTNPAALPLEQVDKQVEWMERFAELQLLGTPVALLFAGVVVSGITYILVSLLSAQATFRRYFTMTLWASVIASLSHAVATAVVRARGVEDIRVPADAAFELSLRLIAPAGGLVGAILSSFELFGIWSLVFLAMALVKGFDMSVRAAVLAVVPWWVITVLVALVGKAVGALG